MRLVEWLLVVAEMSASVSVWMLHGRTPSWLVWLIAASIFLLFVHVLIEGMHWQLGPAYVACCILVLCLTPIGHSRMASLALSMAAGMLIVSSLVLSWILPMFQLPKPSGQYPIGTRIYWMTDPQRQETHIGAMPGNRQVVVQLWYPAATHSGRRACYRRWEETTRLSSYQAVLRTHSIADAPLANGRFPVLIFNHAWGGFRHRCTYSVQDLASHGFIVAAISHTYNSSSVALEDGTVVGTNQFDIGLGCPAYIPLEERLAIADEELRIQTEDCRFVLDTVEVFDRTEGNPLEGHIDIGNTGVYGYSYGGAVSAEMAKEDPRVRAALQLDGVLHGKAALEGLNKPFMIIDSSTMNTPAEIPSGLDPLRESTATMMRRSASAKIATLARFGGYRVYVGDMYHASFSDTSFMSPLRRLSEAGEMAPRRAALIINSYTLAFFQEALLGWHSPLLSEDARFFEEVVLHKYPTPKSAENEPDATAARSV